MAINVAEITSVLKREIAGFEQQLKVSDVGTVLEVGDVVAALFTHLLAGDQLLELAGALVQALADGFQGGAGGGGHRGSRQSNAVRLLFDLPSALS